MNYYPGVLSGMTLEHYQERLSIGMSTSFMEASRARISASQEMEKAWQESEADYSSRSLGCVAKLSRDSSFWKMYLPLLLEEEQKWSGKLPKWGMTVDGALYPLHPLERYTVVRDGSFWPTPCARDVKLGKRKDKTKLRKSQLCEAIGIRNSLDYGKHLCPIFLERLMGYSDNWTELNPWAIQWFHSKRKKRLRY
jgi:hypothetical protein